MIDAPIARSADERTRMAVRVVPSAREAITTFRVLERFEHGRRDDGYSLIECKLFTGAPIRFACICSTRAILSWGSRVLRQRTA